MQGVEREAVICLLQRAHEYAAQGEPLGVKAAFAHDHIKVLRAHNRGYAHVSSGRPLQLAR